MRGHFAAVLLASFIAAGLVKAGEIQPERSVARISSEPPRTFNPFSLSSWLSVPSRLMQYWFPLFQPAYRPPNLSATAATTPRPLLPSTTAKTQTNIFEMPSSDGDSVEYLPSPNEIEW